MTIGEVARRTGVSVQTLRYYERRGLIAAPGRRPSGYRVYAPEVVREVRLIRWAQGLGFRLGEMAELMRLRRRGSTVRTARRQAERKIREIDDTMRQLATRRRSLALVCQCGCRRDCPIVERAIGKRGET